MAEACVVLDPRGDFVGWMAAQGGQANFVQAMAQELGISDYDALLACSEDAQVRAELLTLARQRLPFAFYAVLRRLVRAISPTAQVTLCASDGGATGGLISNPGSPTRPWLGGLVEVLVLTMSRLSQELSLSAERLCSLDASMTTGTGAGNSNADDSGKREGTTEAWIEEQTAQNEVAVAFQAQQADGDQSYCHVKMETSDVLTHRQADTAVATPEPTATWETSEVQGVTVVAQVAEATQLVVQPATMAQAAFGGRLRQNYRSDGTARPFGCEVCGQSFRHNCQLRIHRRIHAGERPYVCSVCGKAFSQAGHLLYHSRTHTGERPFVCETCGRGFSQSSNLNRHRRTHRASATSTSNSPGQASVPSVNLTTVTPTMAPTQTITITIPSPSPAPASPNPTSIIPTAPDPTL
uniref:uncharacterized protein n=1 Tax=Myxine glutinosa TaxID=7769 RepID=UPI00358EEC27